MKFIIEHKGVKRVIDGPFQINSTRKDIEILVECLKNALKEDGFVGGWISVHEECKGSDSSPIPWRVE